MGSFSDSINFLAEDLRIRLQCAHNHPDQKPGEKCLNCGADLSSEEKENGKAE